ncbi:MAG: hypothetical protein RLZZ385_223 [Pseudomonadota bacterium]|jgi:uncharacterized protein (TIGR01777 family)
MRILISGATGLVGRALCNHLQGLGHQVVVLRRGDSDDSDDSDDSGDDFTWQPDRGVIHIPPGERIDGVINLSGANIGERRWTRSRKQLLLDSRLQSTSLLATTVARLPHKPEFFFSASAIGFYGDTARGSVDETAGPGTGFLADIAQQWEQAAAPASDAGIRTVLLRSGVILSPRGGALRKMLPAFRMGLGGVIGSGEQYLSWVGLHEWVSMASFLIGRTDISGAVNLVAPQPVTNQEFTRVLGQVLRRPVVLPLPAWVVKGMFGEMGQALLLSGIPVLPSRLQQGGYEFLDPDLGAALRRELTQP